MTFLDRPGFQLCIAGYLYFNWLLDRSLLTFVCFGLMVAFYLTSD